MISTGDDMNGAGGQSSENADQHELMESVAEFCRSGTTQIHTAPRLVVLAALVSISIYTWAKLLTTGWSIGCKWLLLRIKSRFNGFIENDLHYR